MSFLSYLPVAASCPLRMDCFWLFLHSSHAMGACESQSVAREKRLENILVGTTGPNLHVSA